MLLRRLGTASAASCPVVAQRYSSWYCMITTETARFLALMACVSMATTTFLGPLTSTPRYGNLTLQLIACWLPQSGLALTACSSSGLELSFYRLPVCICQTPAVLHNKDHSHHSRFLHKQIAIVSEVAVTTNHVCTRQHTFFKHLPKTKL